MADDARPTCERCRRPRVRLTTVDPIVKPGMCRRVNRFLDPECDRLLLERARSAEARVEELEASRGDEAMDAEETFHELVIVRQERDALAEAGDALAESIGLASPSTHRALIRWRELRGERHG